MVERERVERDRGERLLALDAAEDGRRHLRHDVDLTGLQRLREDVVVGVDAPADRRCGRLRPPPRGVASHRHERALLALLERVGPRSHRVRVRELLHLVDAHLRPQVLGQDRYDEPGVERLRPLEREHHGLRVRRLHRREVGEVLRVDAEGVLRDQVEREHHVVGRERRAVVPGDAVAQRVGDRRAVGLRHRRERRLGLEVEAVGEQRVVDQRLHLDGLGGHRGQRVEGVDVGLPPHPQQLVRRHRVGGLRGARRQGAGHGDERAREQGGTQQGAATEPRPVGRVGSGLSVHTHHSRSESGCR